MRGVDGFCSWESWPLRHLPLRGPAKLFSKGLWHLWTNSSARWAQAGRGIQSFGSQPGEGVTRTPWEALQSIWPLGPCQTWGEVCNRRFPGPHTEQLPGAGSHPGCGNFPLRRPWARCLP